MAIGPANLPRLAKSRWIAGALAFTLMLSVLSGLFLGLIPAFKYAGPRISTALAQCGPRREFEPRTASRAQPSGGGAGGYGAGAAGGAGLMIRTFQALRTVEPGFTDPQHLETVRISIPCELVPDPVSVTRTQNNLADKLAAIPGVISVGFASEVPMEGYGCRLGQCVRRKARRTQAALRPCGCSRMFLRVTVRRWERG